MSEHADLSVSELYDRFLRSGVDGSVAKTAEAPSSEEIASKIQNPEEGAEGKKKSENAAKAGENLENAGEASNIQEVTPGSPKPLDTKEVPESPGGVKEEKPNDMEKTASEQALESLEDTLLARYKDEKSLRKYASETIEAMQADMESHQRQSNLSGLAQTVQSRLLGKKAEEGEKPEGETSDTSETDEKDKKGEKKEAPAAPAAPAEAPAAAPAAPAASVSPDDQIPMEDLPPEIRQEVETLVQDLAEQTGFSPEEVLEQLNQISAEAFEGVPPEEMAADLSKAAAEAEYEQLSARMKKLSSELDMGEGEVPAEGEVVPTEAPLEGEVAPEGAPAPEGEEDEMAEALLADRSEDEIAALQEAVQELEAQGVPEEVIEEAAREVLSGEIPEEVTKVASDNDWNALEDKNKVVGVLAYCLDNAARK